MRTPLFHRSHLLFGAVVLSASVGAAQDAPLVRPASEAFGSSGKPEPEAVRRAEFQGDRDRGPVAPIAGSFYSEDPFPGSNPFSVSEPIWEAAGERSAEPAAPSRLLPAPSVQPKPVKSEPTLIPVESLEVSEPGLPTVDPAAAQLSSPTLKAPVLPAAEPADERIEAPSEPVVPVKPALKPRSAGSAATASPTSGDNLEGMLHGMIWVTAAIGLGAVVSLWFLRMWLARHGRAALPSKSLALVDTLRLGPRCGVYLVQAESHRVLVGVDHGKSMCIVPLTAAFAESLEDVPEVDPEEAKPTSAFERVADVFTALRKHDQQAKGAAS